MLASGMQARDTGLLAQGDLPAAGRQVLTPKLERLQAAIRLRELAATAETDSSNTEPPAAAANARRVAQAQAADTTPPLPHTPVSAQQAPGAENEGRDGVQLRQVQIELRALRAEIYQLSRAMGFPSRESNLTEFRGILQLKDPLDSDVRLKRWRSRNDELRGSIAAAQRRAEAQRISQRQRELLRALQRAEQRLADAPKNVQPGLRDSIIGEIYRARYSIAMFGGAGGTAQLSGMEYDYAA
jgi:hypothetical protein